MDLAEVVGQLAELKRFPVEELEGESPFVAALDAEGLVGHHAFHLRDGSGRPPDVNDLPVLRGYSARYLDNMVAGALAEWARVRAPDGREFPLLDPAWTADLSERLGRPFAVRERSRGSTVLLTLLSRATLRFAERAYGKALEPSLVRAAMIVDVPEGKAFAEDAWLGRRLRIGDALLAVDAPAADALVPAPIADVGDLDMIRGLLHVRGGTLGLSVRVVSGLRLRAGDSVLLVD
jgi:hypothetical protein